MRSKSSVIRDPDSVCIVNGAKAILSHGFVMQSFFINFFSGLLSSIFLRSSIMFKIFVDAKFIVL